MGTAITDLLTASYWLTALVLDICLYIDANVAQ